MNKKSKEILRKAGWYEGREINIDYLISECKEDNVEIFPSVEKFLKEFGNIVIRDNYGYPYHKFNEEVFYSEVISETVGEPTMQVGTIHGEMFNLYISKSEKVYNDQAYMGENIYEAWDCILETISRQELHKRYILWEELGLKETFKEAYTEYYYGKQLKNEIIEMQNEGFTLQEIAQKLKATEAYLTRILAKVF